MGGTYANHMMIGYADELYYADQNGDPGTPNHVLVRVRIHRFSSMRSITQSAPGTNNWYAMRYGGGSYTNCSDFTQPASPRSSTISMRSTYRRTARPQRLLPAQQLCPSYIGSGGTDPINNGPFTLPPVDQAEAHRRCAHPGQVSWAYFGERWTTSRPPLVKGQTSDRSTRSRIFYCNICNPFSIPLRHDEPKPARCASEDTLDLYDAIEERYPAAVSFVKPSTFNDGHPSSSRLDLFESFTRRIIDQVSPHEEPLGIRRDPGHRR